MHGARSLSLERGAAVAPGTRREVSSWCAHPWQQQQQRANLVCSSGGQPFGCWRAAATLGQLGVPPATGGAPCHKTPTKTALHLDALSTARLGNITEVLGTRCDA